MSQTMPWYPLYHEAFELDTATWTVDQVGSLLRLMNYQWANGSVPNDQEKLARICRVAMADWPEIWETLKPKFRRLGRNNLLNHRLSLEQERSQRKSAQSRQAALIRHHGKPIKINDPDATAPADDMLSTSTATSTEDKRPPLPSVASPHGKKKTQLPEDWKPDQALLNWAAGKHPKVDVERQTELFKDHAQATGRLMKDWRATWRMWIGRSRDFGGGGSHGEGGTAAAIERATGIKRL